jgi:signal transduction histidine kinase/HAMP domain-containing protein
MRRWLAFSRDLGMQLLALYMLLIVPSLVSLLIFDLLVGRSIRADVQASDLSLTRAIAQETDHSITNALHAVEALARYPSVIEADVAGMDQVFSVLFSTRPDVNLIYRLDARGIMLYHYPVGPGSTVGTDFSFRSYYQRSLTSARALVSEGRISPTTQQAVATTVMPVRSQAGAYLGLVATNIRLESLSQTLTATLSEQQIAEGFQVAILDSEGRIIAYPDPALLLLPAGDLLPGIYRQALEGKTGAYIARDEAGLERLYTYAPIPSAGWGVIIDRPTSVAFASQITLHRVTQVASATFLIVGLVFWVALKRRVITPIEKLAPISRAIGENRPTDELERSRLQQSSRRRDQIGHLIRSTFQMEEAIRARMREQAMLLETSTAVVSTLDSQIVLDRILEQVEKLLNVGMSAIIAREKTADVFRIQASRGLSRQFTEQLTIQPHEPSSVTMRALYSREPIQVSDTEVDPSYAPRRPRARAEGYRSVLAVPLNTHHAPPAALLVFHAIPHAFTENEIQLLVSFANQAAMAIENATLFARSDMRLQEQTRRLEALVQSFSDGLILSDPDGRVIYANRRIEELAEITREVLGNSRVRDVLNRILARSPQSGRVRRALANAARGKASGRIELSVAVPGRTIYLGLEVFEVTDPLGISIGRGFLLHDVTADRELDRMKSSLISTVSHELRTPLAAIKGYASTLLAEDVQWDPAAQREFLSVISDESDRLTQLVSNLLDLSRMEAGSLQLSLEECKVEDLIQRAARQIHLPPLEQFEIEIEPQLPTLQVDPPRFETILRNLFENSVKYGGPHVRINVEARRSNGHLVFRVRDDGPGIPTEESQRVFESFYRIDDSLARIVSGAGLGLAICHGLVQAHGGEIWVEPQPKGTCIAFSIPTDPERDGMVRRPPT